MCRLELARSHAAYWCCIAHRFWLCWCLFPLTWGSVCAWQDSSSLVRHDSSRLLVLIWRLGVEGVNLLLVYCACRFAWELHSRSSIATMCVPVPTCARVARETARRQRRGCAPGQLCRIKLCTAAQTIQGSCHSPSQGRSNCTAAYLYSTHT
jgi:hypothetical protein